MTMLVTPVHRLPNARGRKARASVMEAATNLFAERGYAGVSIADVAAQAQVSKAAILYYFPDKDALWRATVDELWFGVDAFYAERWPTAMRPSRALLQAALTLFIEAALRWPAYVRIPFIEGASPSWRSTWLVEKHFGAHVRITDRIIRACQHQGSLPPGDPIHIHGMLTSTINVFVAQAAMWTQAFGQPVDDPAFLAAMVETTLNLTFRSNTVAKSS